MDIFPRITDNIANRLFWNDQNYHPNQQSANSYAYQPCT